MLALADVIIFLALGIGLLYCYFKSKYTYWKSRGVPYKEPTFPLGNIFDSVRSGEPAGKYIAKLYNEFRGPYFGFFAFAQPFLVLKDPDIIKRVLIKDFHIFPNRFFVSDESIDSVTSNSLFVVKNPHWKALRSKLSPVFTSGKMKMMMYLMKECGENLKQHIEKFLEESVEVKELAAKYTTDVIATCAFGINANSFVNENSEFRVAGRRLFSSSLSRVAQTLSYFFAPWAVKIFRCKFLDGTAVEFLRKAFMDTMNQREISKVKRNDLIDILLELKNQETNDDEFKFYGDRLVAQAVIFFGAGHETTSSTIAFTLHELCINSDIQDRLRKEIKEVVAKHGDITYEALQDMEYLDMVVSETLRKYPLTPFIGRECSKDYKIPETGLIVEKGIPIIIPQHGLHWDPKYFPNPEKYNPERFNKENKHKITPYVYLPFGDGPRNCIGERFGLMSSKLGIIYILQNFKVERSSKTKDPLIFGRSALLQAKDGVQLKFKKLEA